MYSFYGGRPGNSFVIITSFPTIAEMIEKFKKGPNYTDVHFDEYVIINTINKNDSDNGKIFRRGYNYTDSQGGAIPVGQIVGPSGPAPSLILSDYNTVKNKKEDPTINPNQIDEKIGSYKISDSSLVPGYEYNESTETEIFNDEIKWISCSIRKSDDETCEAYIGFKIPYLVMDWEVESISANNTPTIQESEESEGHPFYKKWKLGIPRGKRGKSFSDLRIDTTNNQIVYDQISYEDNQDGVTEKKVLGQYNMIQNITKTNEGLSIKYYNNETSQNFSIKQITSIQLDSDYHLNIIYNDNSTQQIPFKCIKEINFDKDNGNLTFTYSSPPNSGSTQLIDTYSINWIKDAEIKTVIDENDQKEKQFLYLNWVNPLEENSNVKEMQLDKFRWIKNLNLTQNGKLNATYNDGTVQTINENSLIQWIKYVDVNENGLQFISNNDTAYNIITNDNLKWLIKSTSLSNDGILTIEYNNGQSESLDTHIKWIDSIETDENGNVNVSYNTNPNESESVGQIHQIDSLTMDETGVVTVEYNDGEPQELGTLKFIDYMQVNGNNHLMVKYSDSLTPVDIGSIAPDISQAHDLNCSGLGSIVVTTDEYENPIKYINFTSSTTALIGNKNVSIMTLEDGETDLLHLDIFLRGSNQQIVINDARDAISSVTGTLTGLNFLINLQDDNSSIYENLSDGDIVDVLITGLNLNFTEPQQEGDNG